MSSHSKTYNSGSNTTPNTTPSEKTADASHRVKNKRTISFTDVTIRNLKPEIKRVDWWAMGLPGFGVRVTPKGTKSFFFSYYLISEKKYKRKTYGTYPAISLSDARALYAADKSTVEAGGDPAGEKAKKKSKDQATPTVLEAIDEWEEAGRMKGLKDIKNAAAYVRRDLGRMYPKKKINKLTKADIRAVNQEILKRGSPGAALEAWQNARRMLNYALECDYIEVNPAAGMRPPVEKGKKDRVLSPKEIYSFWHGIDADQVNPVIRAAIKMILVTLQRGIEVREVEWSEISIKDRVWEIPKEKTKNKIHQRIMLNDHALDLIKIAKKYTSKSPYVFGVSKHGRATGREKPDDIQVMRYSTLSEKMRDNCERWGCNRFTPHDLRRTAATTLTGVGVPRFFIKKALNHVDNDGATSIYDRYAYDYEKQKVAEAWDFVLGKILESENADSVPSITDLRQMLSKENILR